MRYLPTKERFRLLLDTAKKNSWSIETVGQSFEGSDILVFRNKPALAPDICAWSLMHGNEPTGFNALLGIMSNKNLNLSWAVCPLVNPDGADLFQRHNKQGLDINRDARDLKTAEGKALSIWVKNEKPKLALNLHDQRTCFFPEGEKVPASFSILAPKGSLTKETTSQLISRKFCSWMSDELEKIYPNGIARFDDSYYPTAFGEYFQGNNIPTITIETGISIDDWSRVNVSNSLKNLLEKLDNSFKIASAFKPNSYLNLKENSNLALDWVCETLSGKVEIKFEEGVKGQKYYYSWVVVGPADTTRFYWLNSKSNSYSGELVPGQVISPSLYEKLGVGNLKMISLGQIT